MATSTTKTKGGAKMESTAKQGNGNGKAAATDTTPDEDTAPKKGGRKHRTPLGLVYREDDKVCVALHHPQRPADTSKVHKTGGVHQTLGAFRDEGYDFSPVKDDTPDWLLDRLPSGAEPIGYVAITIFPW